MFTKRPAIFVFTTVILLSLLLASGCSPQSRNFQILGKEELETESPALEVMKTVEVEGASVAYPAMAEASGVFAGSANSNFTPGMDIPAVPANARQMIIKNADIKLEVERTDNAMDGVTQIVADAGGYIISSRLWFQHAGDEDLKYATLTIGVPVDQFEFALRRLRSLSVKVLDETASGQDVSDEYVDLQSRLENLQATRHRIRQFLDQAQNVDEALRVNQQLSAVEGEIEGIKGRMNYLSDRAAFSTITINLVPQRVETYPPAEPAPPWLPLETLRRATQTLTTILQAVANFMIWLLVVFTPLALPPALIVWGVLRYNRRKRASEQTGS